MIHLGDITKINGAEIEPVDCITGGSPCQDLSVAGKRAGLAGERSGLFMEQIRVIKEMRQHEKECGRADEFIRPRWMVWENVPGAFSSNDGEDFRAVLEETAKVAQRDACIPRFEGKWPQAGCIMGDGWSIAWRVHDAQFWGVPQRRKRIALVADFGGTTAPEILFECKGVSGDPEQSGTAGQGVAADVGSGIEETGGAVSFQERAGKPGGGKGILIQNERTGALSTLNNQSVVYGISAYNSNSMKSGNPNSGIYEAETARTLDLRGGDPTCHQGGMAVVAIENHPNDSRVKISEDGIVQTLSGRMGTGGGNTPMVLGPVTASKASFFTNANSTGTAETLVATDYKDPQIVAYGMDRAAYNQGANAKFDFSVDEEKVGTCVAKGPGAVCAKGDNNQKIRQSIDGQRQSVYGCAIVRRLTPLEAERLQGFPDGWTDIGDWTDSKGKKHKGDADAPRYKALGNSIALPFWFYLLRRISATYERPATLGSLFDGIGGFPLCWETCNGKGTARWASEIEEFPIAVTKKHFKEDT